MKRFCAIAMVVAGVPLGAQERAVEMVEWRYVGADQAASKHSPLADINASNVGRLEIAWEWQPGERPNAEYGTRPGPFQAMPLMIENVLYVTTMYNRVVALDAETGAQLWAFDPRAYRTGSKLGTSGYKHRGVAVWAGDDRRILINSRDTLYALDAANGRPVRSFGENGRVLLTDEFPNRVTHEVFDQTSPPVVFEDLVIIGSRVPDQVQQRFDTPGSVQAFDVLTGERRWVFYTIPQSNDDFGADTWEDGSWRFTGHANVWGLMSLDADRGLLYIPTSTPSSDYYGGRRLGANLFAESLVCLDARTGERVWHFQAVHHGLWDYDFTSAPNLMTLRVDGRTIDAVAEVSKQGFTYVFDRVTGEPVWPIEERPVATDTDVPGEVPYPTQPFPTRPPPFADQGISLDDANDSDTGGPSGSHSRSCARIVSARCSRRRACRGRCSGHRPAAAQTGVVRRSTRPRIGSTCGRRDGRRPTRSARRTPTCRVSTSTTPTTVRAAGRTPTSGGCPAMRRPSEVGSDRFHSPSRPTRSSSPSTSTPATSSGACRSARGVRPYATIRCWRASRCPTGSAPGAAMVRW